MREQIQGWLCNEDYEHTGGQLSRWGASEELDGAQESLAVSLRKHGLRFESSVWAREDDWVAQSTPHRSGRCRFGACTARAHPLALLGREGRPT